MTRFDLEVRRTGHRRRRTAVVTLFTAVAVVAALLVGAGVRAAGSDRGHGRSRHHNVHRGRGDIAASSTSLPEQADDAVDESAINADPSDSGTADAPSTAVTETGSAASTEASTTTQAATIEPVADSSDS